MSASNLMGRGMGSKKIKLILDEYPDILVKKWDKEEMKNKILEIAGFDDKTASLFVKNLPKFKKFFRDLENVPLINVGHLKIKKVANKSTLFKNQKIVFTGFRDLALEEFITSKGGKVTSTVTNNTTLLVHSDDEISSSKYKKAKDLGVPTMKKSDFENKYINT